MVLMKIHLPPILKLKLTPPVENNIDNDFNDKEAYDDDFDDEYKDPNWNLPNAKKSCCPMEMSPRRENQKVN